MSVNTLDDALEWLDELSTDYGKPVKTSDADAASTTRCLLIDLQKQLADHSHTIQQHEITIEIQRERLQKLNHSKLLYMHLASALFKELLTNEAEQTD